MNIEELSKAQLLLLTVMVNFVVSIATGVLTVSFLDQAPTTVTQGVNRVIEHTIQTIATPIEVSNPIKSITAPVEAIADGGADGDGCHRRRCRPLRPHP